MTYSLILAASLCCSVASAEVIFKAGFETGDLSEWTKTGKDVYRTDPLTERV